MKASESKAIVGGHSRICREGGASLRSLQWWSSHTAACAAVPAFLSVWLCSGIRTTTGFRSGKEERLKNRKWQLHKCGEAETGPPACGSWLLGGVTVARFLGFFSRYFWVIPNIILTGSIVTSKCSSRWMGSQRPFPPFHWSPAPWSAAWIYLRVCRARGGRVISKTSASSM